MQKLRKLALATLIGCLVLLAIAVPVLAAYFADIAVVESAGNPYTMFPAQVPMNVTLLVANGYITPTGLDTLVHAGIHPHMLADDRLLFALPVPATSSNIVEFTTGNALLSNYHIIIGSDNTSTANVFVGDHAELELSDGFDIEIKGWVNTTVAGFAPRNLIYKQNAFKLYVQAESNIRAAILNGADADLLWVDTTAVVTSGEYTISVTADGVNLRIVVTDSDAVVVADVSQALGGNSVTDTVHGWYFMQNDCLPYVEYITIEATDW